MNFRQTRTAFFIALAVFLFSPNAQAQDSAANPYDNVPEEYLQEAKQFHQNCSVNATMNMYYNCECMEVKYLDYRIAKGPDISQSGIMLNLQTECRDATLAAGSEYGRCLETAGLLPKGTDPEKFCTCTANTYARLFQSSKLAANSNNIVTLKSKAHLMCENPALARQLYPDLTQ
ncbi:MAG: hypothetical protein ACT4OY_03075 [Alphaproteobacteria bacterium]